MWVEPCWDLPVMLCSGFASRQSWGVGSAAELPQDVPSWHLTLHLSPSGLVRSGFLTASTPRTFSLGYINVNVLMRGKDKERCILILLSYFFLNTSACLLSFFLGSRINFSLPSALIFSCRTSKLWPYTWFTWSQEYTHLNGPESVETQWSASYWWYLGQGWQIHLI